MRIHPASRLVMITVLALSALAQAKTWQVPDTVLKNFVIQNAFMGCFIVGSSPTLPNLTVVGNTYGIEVFGDAQPDIRNCIFWANDKSDFTGAEVAYSWFAVPPEPHFFDRPEVSIRKSGDW